LWIIFGIIGLIAIGGLFALIAGAMAISEHGATGGRRRTPIRSEWERLPARSGRHFRKVVCSSCRAVGDSEDIYCANCGAAMKG
jgi:hypothetical protein